MLVCSLQIPNLHFSHPLIRLSWREGGRETHSGDRKEGLLPAWESFSTLFRGSLSPQVLWDEVRVEVPERGDLGPGQVVLCLF